MTSGDKLEEAVVEATRQACSKCGHKRFEEISTVYETTSNLPIEEDGTVEYGNTYSETGETCGDAIYFQCGECNAELVMGDGDKLGLAPDECFEAMASTLAGNLGSLIESVSNAQERKRYLAFSIERLSKQNPDIKILSDNCYTIKSSSLVSESWSPEYYDFAAQFSALAKVIEQSSITGAAKKLYDAVESGKLVVGHERGNVVKLHPEVVRILKHSLSCGRPE